MGKRIPTKNLIYLLFLTLLVSGFFAFFTKSAFASSTDGIIDPTYKYAWGENVGWINFGTSNGNVHVTDSGLSGYALSETVGWIYLDDITNDGEGNLSGYAWGENVGYIKFNPTNGGVTINSSGEFSGSALGENIGWIIFGGDYKVKTDWRPRSARPACNNASDDDSDGKTDYPADPGCSSLDDTDETDAVSGGGGGGIISGGGGRSAPTIPSQVPTTPATPSIITPSAIAVSVSPVFTKVLKLGMSGADVKRLQQILNSDSDTQIAASGTGSSGKETDYFGGLTMKALQKFQAKHGIASSGSPETTGYGVLGPKTRAKLAEIFAKATPTAPSVSQPSAVAQIVSPVFNTALKYGITSDEVKQLQELLASDSELYPEGIISGWFGQLTRKAVERFQCKYDIVCSGDENTTGYGLLGPRTRAKLQEVFK